ncbi:nuclear transport factor 2 family protein [Bradyrhizobium sp. BRP14]|nr:nuclear transport factor 2 family protein [Bradyrhizobium sp. BRP14]
MKARRRVEEWIRRFNKGDAIALAELYHENAMSLWPMQRPVIGRAAIQKIFRQDLAIAETICTSEIIHEEDDRVIREWWDTFTWRGCGVFMVRGSRIAFGYWNAVSSDAFSNEYFRTNQHTQKTDSDRMILGDKNARRSLTSLAAAALVLIPLWIVHFLLGPDCTSVASLARKTHGGASE